MKRKWNRKKWKNRTTEVNVTQSAAARTGQGGNAFSINGSDVGVIRTNVTPTTGT